MSETFLIEPEWWPNIAKGLAKPWPREGAIMDLRWHAYRVEVGDASKLPSYARLAERWGWSIHRARDLRDGRLWIPGIEPPERTPPRRQFSAPGTRAQQRRAHALTMAALSRGEIPSNEPCEACGTPQATVDGKPQVIRHHPDYRRPLETLPLCLSCHSHVHYGNIPEPRTGRVYGEDAA